MTAVITGGFNLLFQFKAVFSLCQAHDTFIHPSSSTNHFHPGQTTNKARFVRLPPLKMCVAAAEALIPLRLLEESAFRLVSVVISIDTAFFSDFKSVRYWILYRFTVLRNSVLRSMSFCSLQT